jgi:TatA/E family protein of Tat protein translocase
MFGLQPAHVLIILVIALLFFAPSRLPEFVRAIGESIRQFRGSIKEVGEDASTKPPEK